MDLAVICHHADTNVRQGFTIPSAGIRGFSDSVQTFASGQISEDNFFCSFFRKDSGLSQSAAKRQPKLTAILLI